MALDGVPHRELLRDSRAGEGLNRKPEERPLLPQLPGRRGRADVHKGKETKHLVPKDVQVLLGLLRGR